MCVHTVADDIALAHDFSPCCALVADVVVIATGCADCENVCDHDYRCVVDYVIYACVLCDWDCVVCCCENAIAAYALDLDFVSVAAFAAHDSHCVDYVNVCVAYVSWHLHCDYAICCVAHRISASDCVPPSQPIPHHCPRVCHSRVFRICAATHDACE